jgi:RDD family
VVSTADSIEVRTLPTGTQLRDAYVEAVRALTFGLVRLRDNSVVFGPVEILRFGRPKITEHAVNWPIEGGILSGRPGGTLRVRAAKGRVEATVSGWTPRLPRRIYALTQLQVHLLFTRLYLLRLRGREPAPGTRATSKQRFDAAAVDVALCLTLARLFGRRRLKRTLAIAAVYHVACWSITGRTFGGLVMRQRVVAADGSRLTPAQALFRLALLPVSWITRRPVQDELAATDVIVD